MKKLFFILFFINIFLYANEYKFKPFNSYTIHDFNLNWNIKYFDIVTFFTSKQKNKKTFKPIDNHNHFITKLKVGKHKFTPQDKKDLLYLANILLKIDKYFWVKITPLVWSYDFTSLRFIDESNRFKVIDSKKDIKDMLGDIDTVAEFHLWLYATDRDYPYIRSFSIKDNIYIVKYLDDNDTTCQYTEFIKYYNRNGKIIKTVYIKNYHKKNCNEALS